MFIEFNTAEEAERAKNVMDRHPFDAKHRFQINLLAELEAIAEMDESFTEPEPEVFKTKVFGRPASHTYISPVL
jgi:translation initiation factor 3 subunit B